MMRAVFFGTPVEAIPSLVALLTIADVPLVVTRPDRPRGRSKRLRPPPVKEAALERGLRVVQPTNHGEVLAMVAESAPDVAVLTAYGRLIARDLLDTPARGFVNVHFSLLPRWRGASPVVRAILAGDQQTGVTLMKIDEGLDTGPIISTADTLIGPEENAGELTTRLAALGGDLLATTLPSYLDRAIDPRAQPVDGVTAAGKIHRDEAFIDPTRHSVESIERAVRAFNPRPGAWGVVGGERVKVLRVRSGSGRIDPGAARIEEGRAMLGVAGAALEILEVHPPGRRRMSGTDWLRGRGNEAVFSRPVS